MGQPISVLSDVQIRVIGHVAENIHLVGAGSAASLERHAFAGLKHDFSSPFRLGFIWRSKGFKLFCSRVEQILDQGFNTADDFPFLSAPALLHLHQIATIVHGATHLLFGH